MLWSTRHFFRQSLCSSWRKPSSQAKNAYFRSFQGAQPLRADEVNQVTCCQISDSNPAKPQPERKFRRDNARHRRENATCCQMSDWNLVKPQQEVEIWARKRTAPQGKRRQSGDFGSLHARGPKVAFSARNGGPKTHSAPQENPLRKPVDQKWSKTWLKKTNFAPFFLMHKPFRELLEATSCPPKTAAQTPLDAKPQKQSVLRFSTPRRNWPTPRNRRTGRA